jgi:hypothetical protein
MNTRRRIVLSLFVPPAAVVALVAYPAVAAGYMLALSWIARRGKLRGHTPSPAQRWSLLAVFPTLLVAFALAMAVALWLRLS